MNEKVHPDCLTCSYWVSRIDAAHARFIRDVDDAQVEELRAKRELDEHLARTKHMEAANDAQTR
jgi:hypothetical protein